MHRTPSKSLYDMLGQGPIYQSHPDPGQVKFFLRTDVGQVICFCSQELPIPGGDKHCVQHEPTSW